MRPVWLVSLLASALLWGCGAADDANPDSHSAPTEPDKLHAWLGQGAYLGWESESEILPGEFGGGRRVFVDRRLADSLDQRSKSHPVGSAAVREIYANDLETLRGWSVLIKVDQTNANDGTDWYFYETFDPTEPESINVAERGASGCTFCHDDSPDIVRSEYPLP